MLTIFLKLASLALGTLLGLGLASVRGSGMKPIDATEDLYITNFRGTQSLLQLTFWFNRACCNRA